MSTRAPHESDLHKPLLFQKVGIFIDAENIELSGLKHHGSRTDYKRILEKVGDREIIRILYYKPIYKEISPTFFNFWKGLGGEIKQPSKNADSFLIIDAVTLAEKMDVAILMGGDKDYLPLVWYLRSRGCRVEIWSWPEATSPEVKEAADVYFPLTLDFIVGAPEGSASAEAASRPAAKAAPVPAPRPAAPAAARPVARPVEKPAPPKPVAAATEKLDAAEDDGATGPVTKKRRRRGGRGGRRRKKSTGDVGPSEEASDSSDED